MATAPAIDAPQRPPHDAWVGVGHQVPRYVRALEVHFNNLGVLLDVQRIEREADVARLKAALDRSERGVRTLTRKLALAEEKLGLTSENSSKPPSSGPPSAPKPKVRPKTGKRRGGQPGHPFHPRPLLPAELCASIAEHKPTCCARCGQGPREPTVRALLERLPDDGTPSRNDGRMPRRVTGRVRVEDGAPRSPTVRGVEYAPGRFPTGSRR